ncbi:ATP-dependent DNA helicase Hrp3 [Mucor velutinosus]|uniref:ATP-dependent DNA helicase Hrp3 n=1 Tax=Mucor velutinosus TaxID=708070 RepID=A0AAN7DQW9_9FUNG|nr:ATP-dependent DNA helicase Hrp3 [Mucor velutinosus]
MNHHSSLVSNMSEFYGFCREEEETTFEDALEEYESSKKANEENNTAETQRRPNDGEREKRRGATHTIHDHVAQQLQRQTTASQSTASHGSQISNAESSAMEVDPKTLQRTPHSSDASKHAPLASSLYMHVDSQASVASVSSLNGFQSDVLPLRRHSMSSTSMSQPQVYHVAHRA